MVAGEPYGAGDIAELLIFWGVIGISALVLIQSLILLLVKRFKDVRLGALYLLLSLVAAFSYSQVHKLVAPICS